MKKMFILSVTLVFIINNHLFSENYSLKPVVELFSLSNEDNDQSLEIASKTVTTTIELILKMTGKYNISINNDKKPESMQIYCENNSIDYLLFGNSKTNTQGEIFFNISVFSRKEQNVTITKIEKAETIFDIFNAADILALEVAESFSGEHIAFGSLKMINNGEKGEYRVKIGDSIVNPNINNIIERVLIGNRTIEIIQERMFGVFLVDKININIEEGKITDVIFQIPNFTDEENEFFKRKEKEIDRIYVLNNRTQANKKLVILYEEILNELDNISYSYAVENKKNDYISRKEKIRKELEEKEKNTVKKDKYVIIPWGGYFSYRNEKILYTYGLDILFKMEIGSYFGCGFGIENHKKYNFDYDPETEEGWYNDSEEIKLREEVIIGFGNPEKIFFYIDFTFHSLNEWMQMYPFLGISLYRFNYRICPVMIYDSEAFTHEFGYVFSF